MCDRDHHDTQDESKFRACLDGPEHVMACAYHMDACHAHAAIDAMRYDVMSCHVVSCHVM